jgi:hypothetical protein
MLSSFIRSSHILRQRKPLDILARLQRQKHTDAKFKEPPLYARKPPFWVRWAYTLVACDLIFTYVPHHTPANFKRSAVTFCSANGCYTSWTRWTIRVDDVPNTAATPAADTPPSDSLTPATEPTYSLRPAWQRATLTVIQMLGGAGAAAMLLVFRARTVRTLRILPPVKSVAGNRDLAPRVLVQVQDHKGDGGRIVSMADYVLADGHAMKRTLLLQRVSEESGKKDTFMIELDKAKVFGLDSSVEETRQAILHAWSKPWRTAYPASGWTSGPMARTGA